MMANKKKTRLSGKNKCIGFVGAACSRDRFNSRLQAATTGVFLDYLSLPDKRKRTILDKPSSGIFLSVLR